MAKKVAPRNMTDEEKLELIDHRIDEAAELWKAYARQHMQEMFGRALQRNPIISPRMQ